MKALLLASAVVSSLGAETVETPRLIALDEVTTRWMYESEVLQLIKDNVGFFDITDRPDGVVSTQAFRKASFPTSLSRQDIVEQMKPMINSSRIEQSIRSLSSYTDRYYTSATGSESVAWWKSQYEAAATLPRTSVEFFEHSWAQRSIITRIKGKSKPDEVVILGGHIDSISFLGNSPGADDDASGSAAVFEIFKVLNEYGFQPERTLEFHAYAAEEVGLRGSSDIADSYASSGVNVVAMCQLDMIGYNAGDPRIALVTDYTSAPLNSFARLLIDEYLDVGHQDTVCGYGCSDHASFTKNNYDAIFPFETVMANINPDIHTPRDTLDRLDMQYARQFALLGMSLAVELAA